jgi:hypothetical protein
MTSEADLERPDSNSGPTCRLIDWFAEGESKLVRIGEAEIEVRLVGRKGRRSRIAITAPAGAEFQAADVN